MKSIHVTVPWRNGLHLRQAAALVQTALRFHSRMILKCGEKVADARSLLSVCALCATMGTVLEVEVSGEDEADAALNVEQVFVP